MVEVSHEFDYTKGFREMDRPFQRDIIFTPHKQAVMIDNDIIIGANEIVPRDQRMFVARPRGLHTGTESQIARQMAQLNPYARDEDDFDIASVSLRDSDDSLYVGIELKVFVSYPEFLPGNILLRLESHEALTTRYIDGQLDLVDALRRRKEELEREK